MSDPYALIARLSAKRYESPLPAAMPCDVIASTGFGQPLLVLKPSIGTGRIPARSEDSGEPQV